MWRILKQYFIPHVENGFKPHFWKESSIIVVSVLILLLFLVSVLQSSFLIRTNYFTAAVLPHALADLTNEARAQAGFQPLKVSPKLEAAARSKAEDMAKKGYFAHKSPEGLTPWYWFAKSGYVFHAAGENLAVDFSDSVEVSKAWLGSPKHRANILNPRFSEIGVATIKGFYNGREAVFVVQMLGRPRAVATTPVAGVGIDYADELFIAVKNIWPEEESYSEAESAVTKNPSYWIQLLASPSLFLSFSYWILGFVIFTALLLDFFIEIKKRHPRHILYGASLIILMTALAYFGREHFFAIAILA